MPLLDPGKKAPAFTLKDQDGKTRRLADYAGRPVVLYFYPKDDTPGCTKEACAFRDNLPRFKPTNAVVLGVSVLDEASRHDSRPSTTCPFRFWPTPITAWQKSSGSGRRGPSTAGRTWALRGRRT